MLFVACLSAQDSIVSLKPISIFAAKKAFSHSLHLDTVILQLLHSLPNSKGLQYATPFYIKENYTGGVSGISNAGGSAYHTPIYWEGINLQNPMHGTVDLSNIDVGLFNTIDIQQGGSAALWGSGHVSGALLLGNQEVQENKNALGVLYSYNTMQNHLYKAWLTKRTHLYSNRTKVGIQKHQNSYNYLDLKKESSKRIHAAFNNYSLLQENTLFLKQSHIGYKFWGALSSRQIPSTILQQNSVANQSDKNIRSLLFWKYYNNKYTSKLSLYHLYDFIHYQDSIAGIDAPSSSNVLGIKYEGNYKIRKGELGSDLGYTNTKANALNYNKEPIQNRLWLRLYGYKFIRSIKISLALNSEQQNQVYSPLTGAISLERKIIQTVRMGTRISKNYRFPTLNDLYWVPGGNPVLAPEQSISYEGFTSWESDVISIQARIFSRRTINWIVWQPIGVLWSPINYKSVWSRGISLSVLQNGHLSTRLKYSIKHDYSYTKATNLTVANASSTILNKQLIYIPKHLLNGYLCLNYREWAVQYFHRYTSSVFTTADELNNLRGYYNASFNIAYKIQKKKYNMTPSILLNNLWNTNYSIPPFNPMPLRNWQFSLTFNFNTDA